MIDFDTLLAADVAGIMSDYSQTITVSGTTKRAAVSHLDKGRSDLQSFGFRGDSAIEAVIILADWGTAPVVGNTMTTSKTGATSFRVVRIQDDFAGICRNLICEAVNK